MKTTSTIARILLGLIFVIFGLNFWLKFLPMPPLPGGSPTALFFGALFPTGYLAAIKAIEVAGGLLLLSGRFAALGLTLLGPVIVNILFFDLFLAKAFNPIGAVVTVLAILVLIDKRANFAGLLKA
jgi:putative oxidoreductase